jgi:hypothetical protein
VFFVAGGAADADVWSALKEDELSGFPTQRAGLSRQSLRSI